MASRSVNTTDLIPIYYRIPFGDQKEIVSGYLEKEHVENGKRFYGHFRCEDCGHEWRSGHTWQGYRQECKECYLKNWPEKVYHLEQSTGPITTEPHREDLCEKCQKLGHNCQETHGFGGIGSGRNNKFDQCFNKQFELTRYNILLEPQFIQDLYDSLWDDLDPSDRSEFKDALKFALGNWKTKGNDDQITACEDLVRKIEDPSQRKSRTRKRSASKEGKNSNNNNTNNTNNNHNNNHNTNNNNNNSPVRPNDNPAPQPNKNPSSHPKNNPAPQSNNNPSSHPNDIPAPQPNKNPSSRPINSPTPQSNNNPSSRPKNNPAPQSNNNPSSRPNDSLTVDPIQDPVNILSMLTMLILAVAMLVYFTV